MLAWIVRFAEFFCCNSGTILIASKIILFWEREHSLSYHHGRERESLNPKTIGMRRPRFVVFHPFWVSFKTHQVLHSQFPATVVVSYLKTFFDSDFPIRPSFNIIPGVFGLSLFLLTMFDKGSYFQGQGPLSF